MLHSVYAKEVATVEIIEIKPFSQTLKDFLIGKGYSGTLHSLVTRKFECLKFSFKSNFKGESCRVIVHILPRVENLSLKFHVIANIENEKEKEPESLLEGHIAEFFNNACARIADNFIRKCQSDKIKFLFFIENDVLSLYIKPLDLSSEDL